MIAVCVEEIVFRVCLCGRWWCKWRQWFCGNIAADIRWPCTQHTGYPGNACLCEYSASCVLYSTRFGLNRLWFLDNKLVECLNRYVSVSLPTVQESVIYLETFSSHSGQFMFVFVSFCDFSLLLYW